MSGTQAAQGSGSPAVGDVQQPKSGSEGSPPADSGASSTEPKETNSQQWAALVRREQTLTKQAGELKALEAALKEREAKLGPLTEAFEKHKENPQELLKALGINLPAAQPQDKPASVEERIEKLEKHLTTWEKNLKEREAAIINQSQEQQLSALEERYTSELKSIVEKAPDKFEVVKALGAHKLALEVQRQDWKAKGGVGQPLTPEEALATVEEYLREEYADKLYGTSYLKGKFKPEGTPSQDQDKKSPEKPSPGQQTTVGNNSPGSPGEKPVPLTSDERWNKIVEKRFGPKPPTPRAKPKGK